MAKDGAIVGLAVETYIYIYIWLIETVLTNHAQSHTPDSFRLPGAGRSTDLQPDIFCFFLGAKSAIRALVKSESSRTPGPSHVLDL